MIGNQNIDLCVNLLMFYEIVYLCNYQIFLHALLPYQDKRLKYTMVVILFANAHCKKDFDGDKHVTC